MHPYRALWCGGFEPAQDGDTASLAVGEAVLAAVSAIQVATALPHGGPLAPQALFGAAMLALSLTYLVRHAGSRSR